MAFDEAFSAAVLDAVAAVDALEALVEAFSAAVLVIIDFVSSSLDFLKTSPNSVAISYAFDMASVERPRVSVTDATTENVPDSTEKAEFADEASEAVTPIIPPTALNPDASCSPASLVISNVPLRPSKAAL